MKNKIEVGDLVRLRYGREGGLSGVVMAVGVRLPYEVIGGNKRAVEVLVHTGRRCIRTSVHCCILTKGNCK
jgi:hypothetical protein